MDANQLKDILAIFEKSTVSKMDLEIDGMSLKLEKPVNNVVSESVPAVHPVSSSNEVERITLDAPLVGVFWQANKPGATPYVKVGDTVKEGDVICLIEAMKTMNEVRAEKSGIVQEILVEDGNLVEYGKALFAIGEVE